MTEHKLPAWTGHCSAHGRIEVHQDTPPARCHHSVRRGVKCDRKLTEVKRVPFSSKKWREELERSAS